VNEFHKVLSIDVENDADFPLREGPVQRPAADLDAMQRLHRLGARFVHEGKLEPVLGEIVDAAIAIGGAEFGNIQLLDSTTGDLRIVAQRGFPSWWLDFWNAAGKGQGSCGIALERGERVIVEDVERSPLFTGNAALDIQRRAGVRAMQSTPLVTRSGQWLGMFSTHYGKPHRPDGRALGFLDLLARQAADMIERAQADQVLISTMAKLEVAEDGERQRIARDLHDSLAQMLAAARIRLAKLCEHRLENVRAIAREVDALIAQADAWTRSLSAELAPAVLYEIGLGPALEKLAEEVKRNFGLAVRIVDDGLSKPLSREARSILYRTVRELLINAAKHSRADAATVELCRTDHELIVTVADRGVGFDPIGVLLENGRRGLPSVRERLSLLGGVLDLRSDAAHGTVARVTVPLAPL